MLNWSIADSEDYRDVPQKELVRRTRNSNMFDMKSNAPPPVVLPGCFTSVSMVW